MTTPAPECKSQPARVHRTSYVANTIGILFILGCIVPCVIPFPNYHSNRNSDAHGEPPITFMQLLHGQIELYKVQHANTPPDPDRFWIQMCNVSNTTGETIPPPQVVGSNPNFPFGPYSLSPLPNPSNGQSAIGSAPSPSIGWVYKVTGSEYSLQRVNTTGNGVLTY